MSISTVLDSLNSALVRAMTSSEKVILIGEDILDPYGGAFKVTRGLSSQFPERVIAAPISEAGLVGAAAGMALRGLRPVVEIMFGDFITLAADQLINHVAKFHWMYNEQVTLPMVVRTPMGGRRGYGPTHSQTIEKLFLGVPGLTVLAPCNLIGSSGGQPGDLLYWAIVEQDEPVIFVENKLQYLQPLADHDSLVEFELTNSPSYPTTYLLKVRGAPPAALTLAAYGYMADLARQAQLKLAFEHEIFTELVIPTRLAAFDIDPILESVSRTHNLMVIEEGTLSLGWGAEILARIGETDDLKVNHLKRLAAKDSPVAAASALEESTLPGIEDITQLGRRMV